MPGVPDGPADGPLGAVRRGLASIKRTGGLGRNLESSYARQNRLTARFGLLRRNVKGFPILLRDKKRRAGWPGKPVAARGLVNGRGKGVGRKTRQLPFEVYGRRSRL